MWENTLSYFKQFLRLHFSVSMEVCCVSLWLVIYKKKNHCLLSLFLGFPSSSNSKEYTFNVGDLGSIPMLARSSGEGYGNPLHYSCLENSMDRGAWWATELHSMGSQRVGHSRASNIHTHIIGFSHVMFYNR